MPWCHVPNMDCPSARAAEAWIWASCSQSLDITPAPLSNGRAGRDPSSSRPSMPGISPRPRSGMICAVSTPAPSAAPSTRCWPDIPASLQRRRKARRRVGSPTPLARSRPCHRRMPTGMGLPRKRRRSRHPRSRNRAARALGHGLHACGGSVQRGRSRRAAPAAQDLHPGPHR